jgi:DNA-binding MarR family transcriptional regulator
MVDDQDNDNQVVEQVPGWQFALLLLGAFRSLIEEMHDLLAEQGHPGIRPAHGFALQAVGAGTSAPELAARLGVSRQAAGKTVTLLESLGYVDRTVDPADSRRLIVTLTDRGEELLHLSAASFEVVVDRWRSQAGPKAVDQVASTLQRIDLVALGRLDLGHWSS